MSGQLSSELLKLRTTRMAGLLLLAAAGLTLLGVLVEGASASPAELAGDDQQRTLLGAGSSGAVFFATLAGLLTVTSEFRYGTIRPTLLVQPRRRIVLAAKFRQPRSPGSFSHSSASPSPSQPASRSSPGVMSSSCPRAPT